MVGLIFPFNINVFTGEFQPFPTASYDIPFSFCFRPDHWFAPKKRLFHYFFWLQLVRTRPIEAKRNREKAVFSEQTNDLVGNKKKMVCHRMRWGMAGIRR